MLNSTPRTWAAGETVTAAELNAEIRDAFTNLQAGWTSWTPTLTAASTNPSLGTGSSLGVYSRIGKTVYYRGRVLFGSGATFGSGTYSISLPVASSGSTLLVGSGLIIQGTFYNFQSLASGASTFSMYAHGASSAASPTAPATFTTSGSIYFWGMYDAA